MDTDEPKPVRCDAWFSGRQCTRARVYLYRGHGAELSLCEMHGDIVMGLPTPAARQELINKWQREAKTHGR